MKKFANELNVFQLRVYEYLKQEGTDDGSNLIDNLGEIKEGCEYVPDSVYESYARLSEIERIEIIHFFTKHIMRKNQ